MAKSKKINVIWDTLIYMGLINPILQIHKTTTGYHSMLHLYLIRHANAESSTSNRHDYNRNLTDKGIRHAQKVGKQLASHIENPVKIICSPAKRAFQTTQIIADKFAIPTSDLVVNDEIYEASQDTLAKIINKLDNQNTTVFLVGHNPGLSDLCGFYINQPHQLATAEVASIQFDLDDWAAVCGGSGSLFLTIDPRQN